MLYAVELTVGNLNMERLALSECALSGARGCLESSNRVLG